MNNIIIAPANLPCALCRRTAGLLMLTVCQHTLKLMEIIRLGLHGERKDLTLELVSKELNHLAAILHVYAGGLNFMK